MPAPLLPLAQRAAFHQRLAAMYSLWARQRPGASCADYNRAMAAHYASRARADLFELISRSSGERVR
jgi:hypothetical protein